MELTRLVYVILLCALAKSASSKGMRWEPKEFHREHGSLPPSPLHTDAKKVEQVWKHCSKKLLERDDDIKIFDLDQLSGNADNLSIEKHIDRATKFLPTHMRQQFLDCIRSSKYLTIVSEEQGHWRRKHYVSEHRYLLHKSPSPESALGPSPTSHAEKSHTSTPKFPYDALIADLLMLVTPPAPPPPPPPSPPLSFDPSHNPKQRRSLIYAASASGFIIFIGFILCFHEVHQTKKVYKDDRSLLVISSSDFSNSPGKSGGLENSNMKVSNINYGKKPSIARNLSIMKPEDNCELPEEATPSDGKGQTSSPCSGTSAPAPPPPPLPLPTPAPQPPPPPKAAKPPPAPPNPVPGGEAGESDTPKPKLKPFFWDKVTANPDQAMVWHEIKEGSFQFSEEKIESLFGCTNHNRNHGQRKDASVSEPSVQYIQIIEPKKAQNLAILLRALNVTTKQVIKAAKEGNELPVELIQTLLKMAPTADEELRLRLFTGDISQLGPTERFLKSLIEIPLVFKRLESLVFMSTFQEEVSIIKDCFSTLEVSCNQLRESRLFLKLLEAVLKTGNRMNDGTYRGGAQAFRLDTLLKLADVKGTDGKTTLLHFVVLEIIRSEGIRAVRTSKSTQNHSSMKKDHSTEDADLEAHYRSVGLQLVSGLSDELEGVKKAAAIDGDVLTTQVLNLNQSLKKNEDFLNIDIKNLEEVSEFQDSMESFLEKAKPDVTWLVEEEKRITAQVKNTADYFHGKAGKAEGLRLFAIVRDFLIMLDKVCREVNDKTIKPEKTSSMKEGASVSTSPDTDDHSHNVHRQLFPAIAGRRVHQYSSSDDEDNDESLPT